MQATVTITNGGPHEPATHASITTRKILDLIQIGDTPIASDNPDKALIEAGREAARQGKNTLQPMLEAALAPHHGSVVVGERKAIRQHGAARLGHENRGFEHVDEDAVLASVNGILAQSVFAAHFGKPEVAAVVRAIVHDDFQRVIREERGWFADGPDASPATKAHHDKHYAKRV
jgi:6-phosphofructokinase